MSILTAACGGGDADAPDPPPAVGGSFEVEWSIRMSGAVTTCGVASVPTIQVSVVNESTGAAWQRAVDCSEESVVTDALALGRYAIRIEAIDELGHTLTSADRTGALVAHGDVVPLLPAELRVASPLGAIGARWQITLDGVAAYCRDVGGLSVAVVAAPVDGGPPFQDIFDCDPGQGTSDELPSGAYRVSAELWDDGKRVLQRTRAVDVAVRRSDVAVPPPFVFPFASQ